MTSEAKMPDEIYVCGIGYKGNEGLSAVTCPNTYSHKTKYVRASEISITDGDAPNEIYLNKSGQLFNASRDGFKNYCYRYVKLNSKNAPKRYWLIEQLGLDDDDDHKVIHTTDLDVYPDAIVLGEYALIENHPALEAERGDCPTCNGAGYTIEVQAVCCGNVHDNGECRGHCPMPEQYQEQCGMCGGTGKPHPPAVSGDIIATLKSCITGDNQERIESVIAALTPPANADLAAVRDFVEGVIGYWTTSNDCLPDEETGRSIITILDRMMKGA